MQRGKIRKPLIFDCKVCEHCLKAMSALEYWTHNCKKLEGIVSNQQTDTKQDKIDALENELEQCQSDLNDVQDEIDELEDHERSLDVRICEIEDELDNLAEDDDEEDTDE